MSPLLVGPLGRRIVEGSLGTSNDCLSWKKTYIICSIILKQHAGGSIIEDVVLSVFVARQKIYGQPWVNVSYELALIPTFLSQEPRLHFYCRSVCMHIYVQRQLFDYC